MSYLIRQMGHVVISSPDPMGAAKDLCDVVGLRITEVDGDDVYLSSNNRHHEVTYTKGDGRAVALGLEAISAEAVDEVASRAKTDGLDILDDRPIGKHYDRAVRIVAPGGAIFEIHTPIARDQDARYLGGCARPKRIEHINAFAPDTAAFGEFCEGTLGLKLSDMTEDDQFRWYRAQDGFHHTVAMGPGPSTLHHYAFDLHCLEDLSRIADNLALKASATASSEYSGKYQAKSAGGTETCGKPVFAGTNDPDYQKILNTFKPVQRQLQEVPRMDMAGAKPNMVCFE